MAWIRLAGNYVDGSYVYSGGIGYGHFAVVYASGVQGTQTEIEAQAPNFLTIPFGGDFVYEGPRDHLTNTPNITDPDGYASANIVLNPGQEAWAVWDVLLQIHTQFAMRGTNIDYNLNQNSNAYANTILSVVGIDIDTYIARATPDDVGLFPSVNRNLLTDQVGSGAQMYLNLQGTTEVVLQNRTVC